MSEKTHIPSIGEKPLFTNFCSKYEAILDAETLEVYGYEALAQFSCEGEDVSPLEVFSSLGSNKTSMKNLELIVKMDQVANRPLGYPLFLNINPLVIEQPSEAKFWKTFFQRQDDVVVEITESTHHFNVPIDFISEMEKEGIPCALDDLFCDSTIFCSKAFLISSVVKLDKGFIQRIKEMPEYISFLQGITEFCRKSNKKTVLEGIETEEDLAIGKKSGVNLLQGYYFSEHAIFSGKQERTLV